MKNVAKEPLYKGCPPKLTMLHFELRMLMPKPQFRWLDASFNNLLWLLGSLLPKGKKVHINSYWVKKLFKPVTMGFQKINACPNHYIMYQRHRVWEVHQLFELQHEQQEEYLCWVNANDEGSQGHRRRRAKKRVVREKGYNYRRIPALVMWYLQVVSRLWCLFGNPKDAKMMFMHLISTGWTMACFNMVPMLGNGSILTPCT